MEIKKSNNAQLEDKRLTFFLIGLLIAFTLLFVGLQYQRGPQGEEDLTEDFEDLAQDLDMQTPPDQKDMVSAEAMSKAPASEAITQEVKPTEQQQVQKAEKISTTTSQLVIGDGSGVVEGADVKEAAPETAVDNAAGQEHATHNKKDHNSLNDCVKPNFFHTILLFTNQLTYPLFFITYPQKCG